jgi:hypothetical protein
MVFAGVVPEDQMSVTSIRIRGLLVVFAAPALLAAVVPFALAQTNGVAQRLTAIAVNIGNIGRAGEGIVEIVVNRWSTEAECDRLLTTLLEKGPERLLSTLQDAKRVGYIRTPNSLGYDLHFARSTPGEDGGERIVLATDRRISFWELTNHPRSFDYPFTVIEIHIGRDGQGEGKMSVATKITADDDHKTIVLEDYAYQPVLLHHIKREPIRQ